jgi:regulatory protein
MATRSREKLDAEGIWNYALRLVGGRALTIGELKKKLAARAVSQEGVDSALSKLKEMRVLNDRQFADMYAASRRDGMGMGKARVMRELAQRQVPRLVAETAGNEAYQDLDEAAHAVAFLRRKIRVADYTAYFKDPKNLRSAYRKLRYNGFSSSAAGKALQGLSNIAIEGLEEDAEEEP